MRQEVRTTYIGEANLNVYTGQLKDNESKVKGCVVSKDMQRSAYKLDIGQRIGQSRT